MIQENLKRPLAEELLFGKLAHGGRAHVTLGDKNELVFELEGREKASCSSSRSAAGKVRMLTGSTKTRERKEILQAVGRRYHSLCSRYSRPA